MIGHLLKIIRAQFQSNLWLLSELLVVFVALWVMADYFIAQYVLYHQPVGFKTDRVYQATIALRSTDSPNFVAYPEGSEEPQRNFDQIVDQIRQHPDVEAVALAAYSLPYTTSSSSWGLSHDSLKIWNVRLYEVSRDYFRVFGIHMCTGGSPDQLGRLLSTSDEIISSDLAERFFGRTDVVGEQVIRSGDEDTIPRRIVAVTEPVRNDEYHIRLPYARFVLLDASGDKPQSEEDLMRWNVVFRVRPGVQLLGFEDRFMSEMRSRLQSGNFRVTGILDYDTIRARFLENSSEASGQRVITSVMLFLLVNVFLAIVGSFWFRVKRRRAELGLRMAMGASRRGVLGFTIAESLLLLTLAMLPALLICGNLLYAEVIPLIVGWTKGTSFLVASLLTWLTLALVIVAAVWYPAWRAIRIMPAEALREE